MPADDSTTQRFSFDRYVALSLVVLMVSTYRLWFVRDAVFPVVPSSTVPIALPGAAMTVLSALIVLASLAVVATGAGFQKFHRAAWAIIAAGLGILFLADQAHLQPWAYLTFVFALLFAVDGPNHRMLPRWIVISVYFWSGAGKLDFQFVHTVGQDFLSALTLGTVDAVVEPVRAKLALLMPVGEIVIAVGLAIPRTRRIACRLAIALHLTLIAILGPWSLDHSLGVLIWNLVLIGQGYALFWHRNETAASDSIAPKTNKAGRISIFAWMIAAVVMLGPSLERRGVWDHWLAWSLYAPHTSRVDVQVPSAIADRFPQSTQAHLRVHSKDLDWQTFRLSRWSLHQRGVPIYPQARYQMRLMETLIREHQIPSGVRLQARSVSNRWTGERRTNDRPRDRVR